MKKFATPVLAFSLVASALPAKAAEYDLTPTERATIDRIYDACNPAINAAIDAKEAKSDAMETAAFNGPVKKCFEVVDRETKLLVAPVAAAIQEQVPSEWVLSNGQPYEESTDRDSRLASLGPVYRALRSCADDLNGHKNVPYTMGSAASFTEYAGSCLTAVWEATRNPEYYTGTYGRENFRTMRATASTAVQRQLSNAMNCLGETVKTEPRGACRESNRRVFSDGLGVPRPFVRTK